MINLTDSRYELKYRLSFDQYLSLKSEVYKFARKDAYSSITPRGKYFVKSLYYENCKYLCLNDKVEGEFERVKLRIRCYSPEKNKNKFVSVEIKKKFGEKMIKQSARISVKEYEYYLATERFQSNSPVLEEFMRLKHKHCLSPFVVIDYLREGFEGRFGKKIRLTFDHGLKSSRSTDLFDTQPTLTPSKNNIILLEIKTATPVPKWLMTLIKKYSCQKVQNSKYVLGAVMANANWTTAKKISATA